MGKYTFSEKGRQKSGGAIAHPAHLALTPLLVIGQKSTYKSYQIWISRTFLPNNDKEIVSLVFSICIGIKISSLEPAEN